VTPPDHERSALPTQARVVQALAALVACAGVAWAIWSVPFVMTNDGPEAVLTAHMEAHYDDAGSIFAQQYSVGFGLSGRGFSVLYRPIAALLSFPASLRVSQLVIVLLLALGFAWLCKALAPARTARLAPLLGFAIAFSWPFYMGFFAFTISMAVGLMILAFVVAKKEGLTLIEKAAVTTALLVQLFLHGFAVFLTFSLVALVVLVRLLLQRKSTPPLSFRRSALGEGAWLAISALPSVLVVLVMRTGQTAMATVAGSDKTEWAAAGDWLKILPRLAVPGSTALGVVVFVLALVAIGRSVRRVLRGTARARAEELALLVGAVGLLLAALVLPLNIPGWQFFAPRFLTTGLALALCLLASEDLERRWMRLAFDVGVVALVGAVVLNARALHRRLATACEDALIGLDHTVPRKGYQLPISFDADCGLSTDDTRLDVPYSTALLHFYSLFPVTHGGTVPYGFFGPAAVHAFVPHQELPVPVPSVLRFWGLSSGDPRLAQPKARGALLNELTVFGTYYENVLVFGANAGDRATLLDRGYVVDFEHGSFVNAHFVPCAVELVSDVLPGDPPVMVRGGARQDELWSSRIAPIDEGRGIKASLDMLCGNVWAVVRWQGSEQHCSNADARGRIAFHAEHGTTTRVVCERHPTAL
jgi:hypothetical protein